MIRITNIIRIFPVYKNSNLHSAKKGNFNQVLCVLYSLTRETGQEGGLAVNRNGLGEKIFTCFIQEVRLQDYQKCVIYMLIENLVTERSEVDSSSMMYRLWGKSSVYMKQLSKKGM